MGQRWNFSFFNMVSPMVGYWSVVRPRGGFPVGGYTGGWLAHRWLALSPISR